VDQFQAAYGTVTGDPSNAYDQNPTYTGTNVPITNVSWYEAAQFVNWLNTSTGHQAAYKFTGTQARATTRLSMEPHGCRLRCEQSIPQQGCILLPADRG